MYQTLYRKWRPLLFDDVVAQTHITKTLQSQIARGKTAHAYLFTGSRGTGKTTCARIFAKAVNCQAPRDGQPCLECPVCKDAEAAALADIIEIDAASNNGVDDIRDLREGAVYTPERCKFKVYIIDEVHMLSASAFNALLKIMEEPPPEVKFILATTEAHKVPATILSRCQRFDFHRILPDDIAKRLLYISKQEGVTLREDAAGLIARIADGGMRDALSLLDQCMACSEDVTLEVASTAAGVANRRQISALLEALILRDAAKALELLDALYAGSGDMTRICGDIVGQLRDVMLLRSLQRPGQQLPAGLISCMPEERARLSELAGQASLESVLESMSIFQDCLERMSRAGNRRVELEMSILRCCALLPGRAAGKPAFAVSPSSGGVSSGDISSGGASSGDVSSGDVSSPRDASLLAALTKRVARLEAALAGKPAAVPARPETSSGNPASLTGVDPAGVAPAEIAPAGAAPFETAPLPQDPAEAFSPASRQETSAVSLEIPPPETPPEPASRSRKRKVAAGEAAAPDLSRLRSEDFKPCPLWTEVLEEFSKVCPGVSGALQNSQAFINGGVMLIRAENSFFLKLFKQKENAQALGDTVKKVLGQTYVIRAKSAAPPKEAQSQALAQEIIDRARASGLPVELS